MIFKERSTKHEPYTIASEIQPIRSEVNSVMQEIVSERKKTVLK